MSRNEHKLDYERTSGIKTKAIMPQELVKQVFCPPKGVISLPSGRKQYGSPLTCTCGFHIRSMMTSRLLGPYSQVLATHFKAPTQAPWPLSLYPVFPTLAVLTICPLVSCYLHYSFLMSLSPLMQIVLAMPSLLLFFLLWILPDVSGYFLYLIYNKNLIIKIIKPNDKVTISVVSSLYPLIDTESVSKFFY